MWRMFTVLNLGTTLRELPFYTSLQYCWTLDNLYNMLDWNHQSTDCFWFWKRDFPAWSEWWRAKAHGRNEGIGCNKSKQSCESRGRKLLHPGRLTWNLQITHLERKMIFQTSMIMFHVNLQGCTSALSISKSRCTHRVSYGGEHKGRTTRWAPTIVINGVITPLNGLING